MQSNEKEFIRPNELFFIRSEIKFGKEINTAILPYLFDSFARK